MTSRHKKPTEWEYTIGRRYLMFKGIAIPFWIICNIGRNMRTFPPVATFVPLYQGANSNSNHNKWAKRLALSSVSNVLRVPESHWRSLNLLWGGRLLSCNILFHLARRRWYQLKIARHHELGSVHLAKNLRARSLKRSRLVVRSKR